MAKLYKIPKKQLQVKHLQHQFQLLFYIYIELIVAI